MISSVVYAPNSSRLGGSTYDPSKSPIFQIIAAKVAVIIAIFLLGDLLSQQLACIVVTVGCSLEFWMTKNLGRKYLQAAWSIDTSGVEDVWVYEANFKSPASMQEVFWYSQVVYGVVLCIAAVIIATMSKYSLVCAIIIGIVVNYVNFYAFSKIITLRNSGVLEMIADEAEAHGQVKETIRLPMVYKSQIGAANQVSQILARSKISEL